MISHGIILLHVGRYEFTDLTEEVNGLKVPLFSADLFYADQRLSSAQGASKKAAGQDAARAALRFMRAEQVAEDDAAGAGEVSSS